MNLFPQVTSSPDERSDIRDGVRVVPDVASLIQATKLQTRIRVLAAHCARGFV